MKRVINHKPSIQWLDFLWFVLIKARAGFTSELSGKDENLASHHIAGKPNHYLRYMVLDNGICVTSGEHKFGFHHTGRSEQYRERTKQLRGSDIYDRLEQHKNRVEKHNLFEIEQFLLRELAQYNESIIKYFQSKDYKTMSVLRNYNKLFQRLQAGLN